MSNRELRALGDAECCDSRLRSRRDGREPLNMAGEDSMEIRQLREQLAAAKTEAQTLQEELSSARETVTDLQSQLQTVRLEAEVEKLRAMEQVRQQGDKERHLLRLDKDKERDRLTEQNDQLQSVNQGLRREIASLEEHLAEVQQGATSEHGSLVAAQDGRELVSHTSDHRVIDSLPAEWPHGHEWEYYVSRRIQWSSYITDHAPTNYATSTGTEGYDGCPD